MTKQINIKVCYDNRDFTRLGKSNIIKDAIKTLLKNADKKLNDEPNQAIFELVITGTYDKSKCGNL